MQEFQTWVIEKRVEIAIDLIAGSISGMCNCLSSHPLDTIKVRMQMSNDSSIQVVKQVLRQEGIFAFYKGMMFPLTSVPLLNAVVFSTYEFWRRIIKGGSEKMTYLQIAVCGGIAGSFASLFSCPIELTKCRLQMQKDSIHKLYKNPIDCLVKIARYEGFTYIFRAMHTTQQREILGYGAQFAMYEYTKDLLTRLGDRSDPTNLDLLISGGLGGVACWCIGYPQDTVKTILQCENKTGKNRIYKPILYDGGFYDCAKQLVAKEGFRSLWKGFSVCIFRAFYANAIGFYSYETSKSLITNKYVQ
ncbi:hypothetical protein pb186bvf_013423 [Paramecium bursaria]